MQVGAELAAHLSATLAKAGLIVAPSIAAILVERVN